MPKPPKDFKSAYERVLRERAECERELYAARRAMEISERRVKDFTSQNEELKLALATVRVALELVKAKEVR